MTNPILLTLLIFGAWISYYDLKKGKIKNYSLLFLVLVSIFINVYFTRASIEFPLVSFLNILSAIFVGVAIWLSGLWSAADAKVFSCMAAGIIAKVARDRIMQKYHKKYPCYGFAENKGYPTDFHRKML